MDTSFLRLIAFSDEEYEASSRISTEVLGGGRFDCDGHTVTVTDKIGGLNVDCTCGLPHCAHRLAVLRGMFSDTDPFEDRCRPGVIVIDAFFSRNPDGLGYSKYIDDVRGLFEWIVGTYGRTGEASILISMAMGDARGSDGPYGMDAFDTLCTLTDQTRMRPQDLGKGEMGRASERIYGSPSAFLYRP